MTRFWFGFERGTSGHVMLLTRESGAPPSACLSITCEYYPTKWIVYTTQVVMWSSTTLFGVSLEVLFGRMIQRRNVRLRRNEFTEDFED